MYNKLSPHAEEFISHEEILESLDYAEKNKENYELIDALIEKAALRKGLSHREASVLLACTEPTRVKKMYDLAEQIKKDYPQLPAFEEYKDLLAAITAAL